MLPAPSTRDRAIRLAAGLFGAAALLAIVDAFAIAITVPRPAGQPLLRVLDHLFDLAETLGVGALAAAVAGAFVRFVRVPRWVLWLVAMAVAVALVEMAIGENLTRVASYTLDGKLERPLFVAYLVGISALIPAGYFFATRLSDHPRLRFVPLGGSLAVMGLNYLALPIDYQGIHGVAAWGAALLGGGAIAPIVERWGRAAMQRSKGRAALLAILVFAICGVLVPPPNAVRYELFRQPCAVAPWVLATVLWRAPRLPKDTPISPDSVWLHDRAGQPETLPTPLRVLPKGVVVVLLTIDAVRADAVYDPANAALFPTLTALARESVVFTQASAAGTQTAPSLASLFSGRTFSEQLWTEHGDGRTRFLYPADDPSIRFPQVLSTHHVATANFASLVFLTNEFGVPRGFSEQTITVSGTRHAIATTVINPLIERLRHAGGGPLFLYTHLTEPHEPYDRGRQDGTDRERYLSEIAVADAQIARVLALLEEKFANRWVLFVGADHGEAFGEHGTRGHATTLYEELLHVPLMVRSPLFARRTIDDRVSLLDVGPTILDLFRLPTPTTFLGQSLVPLLAGGSTPLMRPIISEGRLRRALTLPNGLKVIEDQRRKLVEVYDLSTDPGETLNLFDRDPARAYPALATLRAFFAVHTRTEGGYEPPFKP